MTVSEEMKGGLYQIQAGFDFGVCNRRPTLHQSRNIRDREPERFRSVRNEGGGRWINRADWRQPGDQHSRKPLNLTNTARDWSRPQGNQIDRVEPLFRHCDLCAEPTFEPRGHDPKAPACRNRGERPAPHIHRSIQCVLPRIGCVHVSDDQRNRDSKCGREDDRGGSHNRFEGWRINFDGHARIQRDPGHEGQPQRAEARDYPVTSVHLSRLARHCSCGKAISRATGEDRSEKGGAL